MEPWFERMLNRNQFSRYLKDVQRSFNWPNFKLDNSHTVAVISVISIGCILFAYRRIRRILPIQVQCWFCRKVNILPVDNKNQFDCRYCEQYNGFDDDGDYNKQIPAQKDPDLNIFANGAARTGSQLSMYHNGFCNLCNDRQKLKIEKRNQYDPDRYDLHQGKSFQEFCQYLERAYALCPKCESHLSKRLVYQDVHLSPYVKDWRDSRWFNRAEKVFFSNHIVLLACLAPFASLRLPGWFQLIPLIVSLLIVLPNFITARLLIVGILLRLATVYITETEMAIQREYVFVSNLSSTVCALLCFVSTIPAALKQLFKGTRSRKSPFRNVNEITKALSPLLSGSYLKLKQTQQWVQITPSKVSSSFKALSELASPKLSSRIDALSIGKPRSTVTLGPKAHPGSVAPSHVPKSFVFGRTNTSSLLKPSRLSQSFEEFTPPPSQDNSSSSNDYFMSASRWGQKSRNPTKDIDDDDWERHSNVTQVHKIVYRQTSSQAATWTVAVLLAALLIKLCWTDIVGVFN